jgi:hypothetical protein
MIKAIAMVAMMLFCQNAAKVDEAADDFASDVVGAIAVTCEVDLWDIESECRVHRQNWAPVELCCTEDSCRVHSVAKDFSFEPQHQCP